jgi:predicted O-methyltransferase YrrM
VFAEEDDGAATAPGARRFRQTTLSDALRSDVPGSMHGLAVTTGRLHMRAWPEILHSVRTGRPATELVFGGGLFEHLERDRETAAAFDAAMAGYTSVVARALLGTYDFARFRTLVDVGGGTGALLAAILAAHPDARGVNFDLPHVAERARALIAAQGLADRCAVASGDFFAAVPPGGDAYLLKMILHDWDDERSVAILRRVREAIAPDGRVLVLEAVLPEGNAPSPGKLLDVNMLVMTGGRERTCDEFAALYSAAGFALDDVIPAHPTTSIVVGRPV